MGRSFQCQALHGDITQAQRERTLKGFREGHFNILIATDVAARGLDIPNVDLVSVFLDYSALLILYEIAVSRLVFFRCVLGCFFLNKNSNYTLC